MRIFSLLFACALLTADPTAREGNFIIRIEPKAVVQAIAQIPFEIRVTDDLRKPLEQAKVIVRIETSEHQSLKEFRAPAVEPGIYLAKPVFSQTGNWILTADVRLNDRFTSRSIEVTVSK